MLKTTLIDKYYPNKKVLDLINTIPNIKLEITNGYSIKINKTNIKQVFPIIYKINNKLTIFEFNIEEINNKKFYVLEENKTYTFSELKSVYFTNNFKLI